MRNVISKKVINFGKIAYSSLRKVNTVTVEVELYKNEKGLTCLSICGNIWNGRHTDIVSGGQNLDELVKLIPTKQMKEIHKIWKQYHLNDLHPECEHQRETWNFDKEVTYKSSWGKEETKRIGWVTPKEHPEGILGKKCEVCGYGYGTSWKHLEIPSDIINSILEWN